MSGRENERMDARPDEEIEHGQVILRRYREDDLDAVVQAVTDSADHLRPWLPWAANYSRESAEEFLTGSIEGWDEGTVFNYAITTASVTASATAGTTAGATAGALAGGIGLMPRIGPGGLEIGYWVHRAYTRRGLATAASAALVEQAFRLPGVDRLEIVHDELNVASGGIPRKLGFTEVERRRMDLPAPEGSGVGVVWRLTRPAPTRPALTR
jgi:ribosomal-protein-serine acetyltransferase